MSADQIAATIAQANEVVAMIRHHFPGALGSSEVLRRVRGVLDGMGVENILLTQSGECDSLFAFGACPLFVFRLDSIEDG